MKRKVFISSVVMVAIVVVLFSGVVFSSGKNKDDFYKELEIFAEGLAVIEKKYVDDAGAQDLIYGAMEGMLIALDSYSQFLTPEDYQNLIVETEGKFGGLGIEITILNGLLTIVSPIEDTPAWEVGIKAGDVILKIEGELTEGITLNEAVKKLRGDPNTKVKITILREKAKELDKRIQEIEITRGIIKIQDIKRALILEDSIAYVKVSEFREKTSYDLGKALKRLAKEGMTALIIDVRNNPGGLLNSAIDVSSRFLEDGKVVVSTKSRDKPEKVYKSIRLREKHLDIPIVVLINKGSASGSEILAASLRENNRAILLGETTFGKGSVQTIVPLSDGSALRLTTSKYFTPEGNSIHEKGIEPDILVSKEVSDEQEDVFEELKEKKDFDYKKDYQILRGLDLIKGLLVLTSEQGKQTKIVQQR